MSEAQTLLQETVTRLFSGDVDKELISEVEGCAWPAELWRKVESTGLSQPHLLDDTDPSAGWNNAFVILRAVGRYCVPLPLAETMLAGWLLQQAGMAVPSGPLTIIPTPLAANTVRDGHVSVTLERVPWGRHCSHAVAVEHRGERAGVVLLQLADATVIEGCNLALEPRDDLTLLRAEALGPVGVSLPGEIVELYGALMRSAQMAGALEALLDMSVQYAGERVQFGRPIGQFQAIQQELAKLAGYTAEAVAAAEVAFRAAGSARDFKGEIGAAGDPSFEIAAAKVVVGEAAELAPRIAHQVHGAIGFTYEHALHFASRRLWSWRAEFGTANQWAQRLGAATFAAGADALWPMITSR